MSRDPLDNEGLIDDDRRFAGSRYAEVREAMFANPYQQVWGANGQEFARTPVTLAGAMRGMFRLGMRWRLLSAAERTLASECDLRWGEDRKGFQRLLHANGIVLFGTWQIDADTPYTGYFAKGSSGLVIARYSTCCTETRRGNTRSLSMVGRVYPTTDRDSREPLQTASFITQEDIGGDYSATINQAILRNAPDTTIARRGAGAPILLLTGLALNMAETKPTIRQVYQIAELDKPADVPTRAPEFMQFTVAPDQPVIPGDALDFRDEIMAQLYDRGDPAPKRALTFRIETTDHGVTRGTPIKERRTFTDWKHIGNMRFDEAVASYNGDRVLHFHHPAWRDDRNDPKTQRRARK